MAEQAYNNTALANLRVFYRIRHGVHERKSFLGASGYYFVDANRG